TVQPAAASIMSQRRARLTRRSPHGRINLAWHRKRGWHMGKWIITNMNATIHLWATAGPCCWRTLGIRASLAMIVLVAFPLLSRAEWGEEIKLSSNDAKASLNENMGHCLIASDRTLHAVWTETKGADRAIHYRRSADRGATWSDNVRISPTPGFDS